jgi:hypothetical protein
MTFPLTPIRMATIKNTKQTKKNTKQQLLPRMRGKVSLLLCWWECKLVQPIWKAVWRFPKKLKLKLLYDPRNPLLGIYLKKLSQDTIKTFAHSCLL